MERAGDRAGSRRQAPRTQRLPAHPIMTDLPDTGTRGDPARGQQSIDSVVWPLGPGSHSARASALAALARDTLRHADPTSSSSVSLVGAGRDPHDSGAGGGQRRRHLAGETIMHRRERGSRDAAMRGAVEIGLRAAGGKMQHAVDLALRQRRRDRRRKVLGLDARDRPPRCARAGRRRRDRRRGPRRRDRAAARGRWILRESVRTRSARRRSTRSRLSPSAD